jgi:methylase of polypeptide subunit release factors
MTVSIVTMSALPQASAIVTVGHLLRRYRYSFVTVTPETHRRVVARHARGRTLRDAFGWNLPFGRSDLPADVWTALQDGGLLEVAGEGYRSLVRFASLDGALYAHSKYPTHAKDSVFLGPDTYRFARAIRRRSASPQYVVDVGCGAGAGGVIAGAGARRIVLSDVSATALAFARANAELNGVSNVELVLSDVLANVDGAPDLVVANPPYLLDRSGRTYRDGGGDFGSEIGLRIVEESLARLAPGGSLLLYTGTAVVDGVDTFRRGVDALLALRPRNAPALTMEYEEIDPDVFGEELDTPAYAAVERIAAVSLNVTVARS